MFFKIFFDEYKSTQKQTIGFLTLINRRYFSSVNGVDMFPTCFNIRLDNVNFNRSNISANTCTMAAEEYLQVSGVIY